MYSLDATRFSVETRQRLYNPDNNPHLLNSGDCVLIKFAEENKTDIPEKYNNQWVEVDKISLTGIPKF